VVSIPAPGSGQSLSDSLKAANRCGEDSPIVLPKVVFRFNAEGDFTQQFAEQAQALQSLPASAQVWLHLGITSEALTGKETEAQITEQVADFLKQAPLSAPAVRGVILEPDAPQTASDHFVFALLRLAVAAKSGNSALRLAVVFPASSARMATPSSGSPCTQTCWGLATRRGGVRTPTGLPNMRSTSPSFSSWTAEPPRPHRF
jgi:hypothetical protein